MTAGAVINVASYVSTKREKQSRNQWTRNYSVIKYDESEVKRFIEWFQESIGCCNHITEGVEGLLSESCIIPTLNQPFIYNDVVITLSAMNGKYAVMTSADTRAKIRSFWTMLEDY